MIIVETARGIATVTLNRPESHNALTPEMIATITTTFVRLGNDDSVRVIVLTGAGRSFCAGADLAAMRAAADVTFEENVADGEAIFDLMSAIDSCPRPVIGRINGAAIGGGAGMVSCCDVVVAVERAIFAFSEVRLGIVPAVISPFVVAKIGQSAARELFLTGERFLARRAQQVGLVHHVVPDEATLDEKVADRVAALLQAAPGAQAVAKELVTRVAHNPRDQMRSYTSQVIAERRASAEGREGMSSFLERRPPAWQAGTK
ncbi:MAG: enoyl-CoA hydratase-related protein [Anaerolineae bacterium]|nr:enoyl-CoA hydratase-related protein [Anaerolineae bacterium]